MAIEAKRGCGYRKVGGLYMMGGKLSAPCCKLPILLHTQPAGAVLTMVPTETNGRRMSTTQSGFKQVRGYAWVDPRPALKADPCISFGEGGYCPVGNPDLLGERVVLMWIGTAFYPRPTDFIKEAAELGVSRRIPAIPKGFKLGEHSVLLAHPRQMSVVDPATGDDAWIAGVFSLFKPSSIDKIVTETQSKDEAEMQKLADAGITPVVVPDDDKDHQGTVYDGDDESLPFDQRPPDDPPAPPFRDDCDPIAEQRMDASDFEDRR